MVDRALEYYKFDDPWIDEPNIGMTYVEISDGAEIRHVTVVDDRYFSSNVELHLGEKAVDYQELENYGDVARITKQEFDAVWKGNLKRREAEWIKAKTIYPIGSEANGVVERYFPQGVIVFLEDNTIGLASRRVSKASIYNGSYGKLASLDMKQKITAKVVGYDEVNQWIVLDEPREHTDK